MVEQMTGLPIGFRVVRCKFAKESSPASMRVEELAIGFYQKNCISCSERIPVQIPNIATVAEELRIKAEREEKEQKERRSKSQEARKKRHLERESLKKGKDPVRDGLLTLINKIDDVSSKDAERQLLAAV